jgi:uroporphyrinogen decarboxylase
MKRSEFIKATALGATAFLVHAGCKSKPTSSKQIVNKRERMLQWIEGKMTPDYTPAAFFIHFDADHKLGSAAAARHLEYFRATDMDFVKIQYEQEMQPVDFIKKPADWARWSPPGLEFYEPQLQAVREIIKNLKKEALIIMTIYSPFMSAGHAATKDVLLSHLEEHPDAVKQGLDRMTESQMLFVKECIRLGVDGFYMSTQGSETKQLSNPAIFKGYIKPSDLVAMTEAQARCPFNILHVCDYHAPYASYDAVLDYPGHVVNCNPQTTDRLYTWQEIQALFHRQFILGADCTAPGDIDWKRLRLAIDQAHGV